MILVAGSANLDFVVRAEHIPAPGETVLGHEFHTYPGGKGANQAVACARAGGVPTHLLAAFGTDAFATPIETSLQNAQVQLHAVRSPTLATGTAFICVSALGENAITVAPGANLALRAAHLPALQGFSHLLLQLETPLDTVTAYAQAAHRAGIYVALNAAPARPLPPELLACLDLLLVNETELACIAGHNGSIAECLQRITVASVVVTLGGRGCCARHLGELLFQPAFPIVPLDTTGAGDTFCGCLCAQLSQGSSMPEALRYASAASALACTRAGAQTSIPGAAEVRTMLQEQNPNDTAARNALCSLRTYCGLPPDTTP
jgi:ribokinase